MRTARNAHNVSPPQQFRTDLKVYGMKDAASAQAAYDAVGGLEGVHQIRLDIGRRRVAVIHSGAAGMTALIAQTLREIGLRVIHKG